MCLVDCVEKKGQIIARDYVSLEYVASKVSQCCCDNYGEVFRIAGEGRVLSEVEEKVDGKGVC